MSESHKNPFQGLVDVASEMNRMRQLGRYGYDPGGEERERTHATAWVPTADIFARGRDLVIRVELAGAAPQDIVLTFQESVLTISGERKHDLDDEVGELLLPRTFLRRLPAQHHATGRHKRRRYKRRVR